MVTGSVTTAPPRVPPTSRRTGTDDWSPTRWVASTTSNGSSSWATAARTSHRPLRPAPRGATRRRPGAAPAMVERAAGTPLPLSGASDAVEVRRAPAPEPRGRGRRLAVGFTAAGLRGSAWAHGAVDVPGGVPGRAAPAFGIPGRHRRQRPRGWIPAPAARAARAARGHRPVERRGTRNATTWTNSWRTTGSGPRGAAWARHGGEPGAVRVQGRGRPAGHCRHRVVQRHPPPDRAR